MPIGPDELLEKSGSRDFVELSRERRGADLLRHLQHALEGMNLAGEIRNEPATADGRDAGILVDAARDAQQVREAQPFFLRVAGSVDDDVGTLRFVLGIDRREMRLD